MNGYVLFVGEGLVSEAPSFAMKKAVSLTVVMEVPEIPLCDSSTSLVAPALCSPRRPLAVSGPWSLTDLGVSHLVSLSLLASPPSSVTRSHSPGTFFPQTVHLSL